MEFEIFKKELKSQCSKIKVNINDGQVLKFYKYMNMLIEWNEKINLTAIVEPKEIILKHFIDSLTVCNDINEGSSVADIGTGAGFPGIPLKILRPDIDVTLMDSLNKRINFLQIVIKELELNGIVAIHGRIEDFGKNKDFREKFDYSVSRAVANLSVLSEYMLPLVKVGGKCICMKGSSVDEELKKANKAIDILGGKLYDVNKFFLPDTDMGRNIVIIKKEKNTPSKYPRKPRIPNKEPI